MARIWIGSIFILYPVRVRIKIKLVLDTALNSILIFFIRLSLTYLGQVHHGPPSIKAYLRVRADIFVQR